MRALAPTLHTLQSSHDTSATQHRCAGVVAFGAPRPPNTHSTLARRLVSVAPCLAAALALTLAACSDNPVDTTATDTHNASNPNNTTNNTPEPEPSGWRYVLVEDTTSPVAGDSPGLDLDAIELTDHDGATFFATTVEDFHPGGGTALDPAQALGPPKDTPCDLSQGGFVALGGLDANGYIIVGFSTPSQDVTFRAGASVRLHAAGTGSMCGRWEEDPYSVSVSVSTNRASFTQIGTGAGSFPIPVASDP